MTESAKAKEWIAGDESAQEMLSRVDTERKPCLLLPPLHRVPLHPGDVVELLGPSPSSKTHLLTQAAIQCIIPKEYGGLGSIVLFIDLDCRFDALRLAQMLKRRLARADGLEQNDTNFFNFDAEKKLSHSYDEELFVACMRRFLYIQCYDTIEFLATLKTLCHQLYKEKKAQGVNVHALMIDSIGALYWVDRASSSFHHGGDYRKCLSLQHVSETVVQEIKKLLLVHPLLVIATKSIILGDRHSTNEGKWSGKRPLSLGSSTSMTTSSSTQQPYHEYMPSVWQTFVTHRMLLRPPDDQISTSRHHGQPMYSLEWLLPQLDFSDNFVLNDAGIFCI